MSEARQPPSARIPVYQPHFSGKEREYVLDCMDTGWISSRGDYVGKFEKACADYIGIEHVSSVFNGTVALHLALAALGVGPGHEVIVPTLTYVASVNAMHYVGATPVFCECDPANWQLDPADVARRITPRTKAIMVVHLYGQPAPMPEIMALARKHGLFVIEDAAEALGSRIGTRHAGTWGDVSTFSFFGNKTLTTGEGGLVVTPHEHLHREMSLLKTHYISTTKRYWHDKVGFNFRMTNIQAAIGLGQFVDIDWVVRRKRELAALYRDGLEGTPVTHHVEQPGTTHNYWMCSILVPRASHRDALMAHLDREGIETRPVFYPVHTMPMYAPSASGQRFPISDDIASRGINLPSWPDLGQEDVVRICDAVKHFFKKAG
jgi:perosamine synthetase